MDEQLPPPPSPPQLKEAGQLDGVPRPNSVDRILHPDGNQHILTSHEALNKVIFNSFSLHRKCLPIKLQMFRKMMEEQLTCKRFIKLNIPAYASRRMLRKDLEGSPSARISYKYSRNRYETSVTSYSILCLPTCHVYPNTLFLVTGLPTDPQSIKYFNYCKLHISIER